MKLFVTEWKDLATVLDSIPQKDLPTTADVRKCVGAVGQIRKAIKGPMDEFDKINDKITALMKPYQDKIAKLDREKEKEKVQKLIDEANKKLKPINNEREDLDKKYQKEEINIDLDENYKTFIKTNWEEKIRPAYNSVEAMLRVADEVGV